MPLTIIILISTCRIFRPAYMKLSDLMWRSLPSGFFPLPFYPHHHAIRIVRVSEEHGIALDTRSDGNRGAPHRKGLDIFQATLAIPDTGHAARLRGGLRQER